KCSRFTSRCADEVALHRPHPVRFGISDFRRWTDAGQLAGAAAAMNTAAPWRAGVATDTGLHRSNNEDRVHVDEAAGIFLVVDGLGGHAAGERAAEVAVKTIPDKLAALDGDVEERIRQAITAANNEIFELAQ